jgi:L-threonylcarbamoyladenylate synthase
MRLFKSNLDNITRAVDVLATGHLVALPTETVYGLGGDCENEAAVAAIYAAKARPAFNPLIVHVDSVAMAQRYGQVGGIAATLANLFWPDALTLVVPRVKHSPLSLLASAGMDSVAIRCPKHPVMQQVIERFGRGICAPSANRSGRVSPTCAEHVLSEFEHNAEPVMILDGGPCAVGVESTVVDCTGDVPLILRAGSVTLEMLQTVFPDTTYYVAPQHGGVEPLKSPGMLLSHYAPSVPVRLNVTGVLLEGEALLAFGREVPQGARYVVNLSENGDVQEAAANLFAGLRVLDKTDVTAIAVMPIPESGLGVAINDRLRRAAAPRDIGDGG